MKLTEVRIKNFRNIIDSGDVDIQPDVTCIVGKNESGKTAFLQALHRLNPVHANVSLSIPDQYPAWLEKQHRRKMNLEEFCPVHAKFKIEPADLTEIEKRFGKGVLKSDVVEISRSYNGKMIFIFDAEESIAIGQALAQVTMPSEDHQKPINLAQLKDFSVFLKSDAALTAAVEAGNALDKAIVAIFGKHEKFDDALIEFIDNLIPKFFYYADYSSLPGTIKIRELLKSDRTKFNADQMTAVSLLDLAGAEDDYLLNPDYERRKRELENVANALTQEILEYWTTNKEIRVDIDISQRTESTGNGQQAVIDELKVRLWDNRHFLSLPFGERSSGFRWFFSFLAAFSAFRDNEKKVIILLDEPALGLHARAQKDFLRYIDEQLTPTQQVIFSTHSPFMVQPEHLDRVRMVEDHGREIGSKITSDILATDPDTLFPLQSALGYDLAQHLFVAPHNLVVEGTSDLTYLSILSRHLVSIGREGLDARWSLVPVGGADMVPTFVALLGNHLEITVLVDSQKAGHQRLERMADQGLLKRNRIIMIGQVFGQKFADIEDVFTTDDYVTLYNAAFGAKLNAKNLTGTDPILARIERHSGTSFDHGAPADLLLRKRDEFLPKFSAETLDRFETLFKAVNTTLPK